ncbi:MAG: efflux RND transporter periplasmic adaptor subunit [Chlorobium sp.]|jgi:RND family efflux transporter MFP subunit|nr:efflux RND transporter periplasmic adaptor subunit [Chlorobium sp.]
MPEWIKTKKFLSILLLIAVVFGLFLWAQRRETPRAVPSLKNAIDRIPVSIAIVSKAVVRDSSSIVGTVEAFREADIYSESEGLVRRVSAEAGDHKKAGEELFRLDDELSAIRQRRAETYYRQKKKDFERYKNLYSEGAIPLSAYETAQLQYEEAQADLVTVTRKNSDASIKAPFSGEVTARFVEQGELVRPGMKVAHLVDLSKVKVILFVPERERLKFAEGKLLKVSSDLFPGEIFQGTVKAVSNKSGRDHTCRVEVLLHNSGKVSFTSGMFAKVLSSEDDGRQAILVPRAALVSGIRKPELFLVRQGKAFLKPFVVGRELRNNLEVLSGLLPGDSVVVSGQNELNNGTPVVVIGQQKGAAEP